MRFPRSFPRLFHPPIYQGKAHPKNYFEGWYYKNVNADGSSIWSVIFGVSYSADSHSFIQVIEGRSGKTEYYRFALEEFSASRSKLEVYIGPNMATERSIRLKLEGELFTIVGELEYQDVSPYPQKLLAPGIMGWYTFAPFMECYHGVASMNHSINGKLAVNGIEIDFSEGKGYIEKDWGRSMPSDWIWIQCNHFEGDEDASMMLSVARIPWLNGHFPGFLSFIKVGEEVYNFATYNRSVIEFLEVTKEKVLIKLRNRRFKLEIIVQRNQSGELKAPVEGMMNRKIAESLDSTLEMTLTAKNQEIIFKGKGEHAGLEVVGDIRSYLDTE